MDYYKNRRLPPLSTTTDAFYEPDQGLIAALDVALELSVPLLLTGEPGVGKTRFADHVAQRFDLGEPIRFFAKTTSTAGDLFYQYDALRHFHLVQNVKKEVSLLEDKIIRFQALGEAIRIANEEERRSVVLIDEIDKAPRDFPNDLLNELEGDFDFFIPEMNRTFSAPRAYKPILVITSNSEKTLPEPFLRRCVYYHIPFPGDEKLLSIVTGKLREYGLPEAFSAEDLNTVIGEFHEIRKAADKHNAKKPATAELISWLLILHKMQVPASAVAQANAEYRESILQSYAVLAKSPEFRKALVTRLEDMNN